MFKRISLLLSLLMVITGLSFAQSAGTYADTYQLNYYSNRNNAAGADAVPGHSPRAAS